jgi:DNA-binding NtrC family response regulator
VAEDDDGIRNLVAGFLRQYGYRVLTAKDGLDALEVTSAASIEVLLTDLVMPKMGGCELAERLREKLPGLKVILMSGHAEHCALHADGVCFLQKPFSMLALATAIRDAVSPQPSRPAMS